MADELLKQAQEIFEGQIDFEGQKKAELITNVVLALTGVAAFVSGCIRQDIWTTLWVGLGGTALTFLIVVPPLPFYRSNPELWIPAGVGGADIAVDGKKLN